MTYLIANIRYLRKEKRLTQQDLATRIGVTRSIIGAYEECRAEPKIVTIQKLAHFFKTSLDALINHDLSKPGAEALLDVSGQNIRVLPVVVDGDEKERMTVVPMQAEAGYAGSYGDPDYIRSLPSFSLPFSEVYEGRTYRFFQIRGDSMLPVPSGSYIMTSYLEDWRDIKDGACYIVVTRDSGIVYKRVWNQLEQGTLLLKSDNPLYQPYEIEVEEILEVWVAGGYMTFDLPGATTTSPFDVQQLSVAVAQLQTEMARLKNQITTANDENRNRLS